MHLQPITATTVKRLSIYQNTFCHSFQYYRLTVFVMDDDTKSTINLSITLCPNGLLMLFQKFNCHVICMSTHTHTHTHRQNWVQSIYDACMRGECVCGSGVTHWQRCVTRMYCVYDVLTCGCVETVRMKCCVWVCVPCSYNSNACCPFECLLMPSISSSASSSIINGNRQQTIIPHQRETLYANTNILTHIRKMHPNPQTHQLHPNKGKVYTTSHYSICVKNFAQCSTQRCIDVAEIQSARARTLAIVPYRWWVFLNVCSVQCVLICMEWKLEYQQILLSDVVGKKNFHDDTKSICNFNKVCLYTSSTFASDCVMSLGDIKSDWDEKRVNYCADRIMFV